MTRWWPLLAFLAVTAAIADDERVKIKEQELVEVRERIEALRQSISAQTSRRAELDTGLRQAESELAEIRRRLEGAREQHRQSSTRLERLLADAGEARGELAIEIGQLGAQLRAAYTSGSTERLQLILNQRDPVDVGRMSTYYGYVSDSRKSKIAAVERRLEQLAELHRNEQATRAEVAELAARRERELKQKNTLQSERQRLLSALDAEIDRQGGEVLKLTQQEADLERLIVELSSILSDYPITSELPFSSLRGQLTWPVAGRLRHDYGQPRAGSAVTWNGVILAAERGREVRALYHGRVAFADWLPGLGLLLVLEHGEGYLSLYGHNDTLLKSVGDWVAAGDAIATIGDSGGQAEPGLYLEIRNGTRPLNPGQWISKRPRRH